MILDRNTTYLQKIVQDIDKKKALKYGILTFAITFALVLLISYLFYIGGHKWKE